MRIDKEIEQKQSELNELVKQKAALEEFTYIKRIAIELHDSLCHDNHDDGCGWGWEYQGKFGHDWRGYAHQRWLNHAERVIATYPTMTVDEFIDLADFIKSIR